MKLILERAFGHPVGVLGKLGGIIMARTNQAIAARTIALLAVQPDDWVLEVGFGPGVGLQLVASKLSSGRIAGVDDSAEMVEQAAARNAGAVEAGRIALRRGPVASLPFANDTFDKALAINSMQVWPDAVAGLKEILRVLKAGGIVALGFTRYSGQA